MFDNIEKLAKEVNSSNVYISNINSPTQIVVSGHFDSVSKFIEELKRFKSVRTHDLDISAPFHTNLMAKLERELHNELQKMALGLFQVPVISNVTGMPYTKRNVKRLLPLQAVKTVNWMQSVKYAKQNSATTWVSIGPKKGLLNIIYKMYPSDEFLVLDTVRDLEKHANSLTEINEQDI